MTRVKICGIKSRTEALLACRAGAWAIGEVFAPSPRKIEADRAAAINRELGGSAVKVGIFVNEKLDTMEYIVKTCGLDMVQLHGQEPPELVAELPVPVIKCFPVKGPVDPDELKRWRPWAYLFDTAVDGHCGGSGLRFNWDYLEAVQGWDNLILAGGLHAGNVAAAVKKIRPLAVDVSSGVEFAQGGKDPQKVGHFINEVREADKDVT